MADLRDHTSETGSLIGFCPTINLFIDLLHRLSLERTGDSAAEASDIEGSGSWLGIRRAEPRPLSSQPLCFANLRDRWW